MPKEYSYETSPRKLAPNYAPPKKSTPKVPKKRAPKQKAVKAKEVKKKQYKMIAYILLGFMILFAISFRNSQIDENFAQVKRSEEELANLKKQNTQLEIAIENNMNLKEIEQQAKELLGMQKMDPKQIVYVSLPTADYIETPAEDVQIEEEKPLLETIWDKVQKLFK